jgi:hypothetical protein
MAATNFTPIILYHTTTASAAPTAGNLNNGELAINITDGKLFYKDNGGTVQVIATKGTGTIGGSNTQVQYNSSGALAGSANFTFNGTTATINTLNLTNALGTAYGGTALTTYTQGDLVYASAANTLAKLGIGANTYILTSTGSVPQWSAPSAVTVATANNLAGGAAGSVPYQSGASTTTFLSIGSAGQVLTSSGTAPQWSNLSSLGVTSLSFGTTGLTPSSATQGAITVAGTLATTNGGTGLTSFTANGVFYASSTSAVGQSANLTFDGTTLVASNLTDSSLTTGRVVYTTTGGNLTDSANLLYSGTDLTVYGVTVGRGAGAVATNTAVGGSALAANTTGAFNTAVGLSALAANLGGSYNTAVGRTALTTNTSGTENTGIGANALQTNLSGNYNTAVGVYSLVTNSAGNYNTAVGHSSLWFNTGSSNTAVGFAALYSNTTASNSTAVGYQAGYYQTGGRNTSIGLGAGAGTSASNTTSQSTFIGFNAGTNIQGGSYLVLIGDSAGASNTTGSYNVAIGQNALVTNQSGGSNIAIGAFALSSNLASSNVAIGYQAAFNTTTDTQVIAIGYNALFENTTGGGGSYNIAIGQFAHYYGQTNSYYNIAIGASAHRGTSNGTQTGRFNTAIGNPITPLTTGSYVLGEITSGSQNVALGNGVLGNLTSGNNNTAAGFAAMQKNSTGSNNTAIGRDALSNNTNASGNTAIGYTALYQNQTGVNNTALGNAALYYTGGDSNIGIGVSAGQSCTGTANIAIGSGIAGVLNSALSNQTGGSYNVAIGSGSLSQVAAAYSNNTAVGHNSLFTASGSTNTAIGFGAGSAMTTGSKNTILGGYTGNNDNLDLRTLSNRVVLSDGDGNVTYYNSSAATYLVTGKTIVAKDNMADDSLSSATQIFGQKTAGSSGSNTLIYFCEHTNSHNLRVIVRQDTSNVGAWIGTVTVAYGGSTVTTTSAVYTGNVTNITVSYNNAAGSPSYQMQVAVTYTGAAPTIFWFADGIFASEPYAT